MRASRSGALVIIGGHENKDDDPLILKEVVRRIGDGKLVVATVATTLPEESWDDYERVFRRLGIRHLFRLDVQSRADAYAERKCRILDDATGVFFTGGDQLKITMLLGASPICERIHEIHASGGVVCGTSAGASVLSDTMLVGGASTTSARIGHAVRMAPGLALISDVLIDQHFAERGRINRLLAVVGQNPRVLGIGIDENTAIEIGPERVLSVIGEGGVTVLDGSTVSASNLTSEETSRTMSLCGVTLHVLSQGDTFDLATRVPSIHPADSVEEQMQQA